MKRNSTANNGAYGSLADRLRTARRRAAISQTELARSIGISASAVAQWEHPRGTRPTRENLIRVAEIIETSFEWLATGKGNLMRPKSTGTAAIEVPAVTLEVYARTMDEETLLAVFRNIPASRRALLISIAEEFATSSRHLSRKRR